MKQQTLMLMLLAIGNLIYSQETYLNRISLKSSASETMAYTTESSVKKPKQDVAYHWFKSNRIHRSVGDYDGKLLNGTNIETYKSGQLKEKGNFKNGLKHGAWKSWQENGLLLYSESWRNGKKHGKMIVFNEKGSINNTFYYKNNQKHGKCEFYENGVLVSIVHYKKGAEIKAKTELVPNSINDTNETLTTNK